MYTNLLLFTDNMFFTILELKASKEEVSVLKTEVQTLQEENVGKLL